MVLVALTLCGCASPSLDTRAVNDLAPLQIDGRNLSVTEARERVARPDLLSLDEPMREFVARYTAGLSNKRARLMALHQAVRGTATLLTPTCLSLSPGRPGCKPTISGRKCGPSGAG